MVLCLRSSNQYFKECRYHEDKKSFINTIVCDFFDNIYISPLLSKVDSCLLKEAIINNLSDKRAFTSFFYMGRKIRRAIESEDYSLVGLPSIVKQYSSKVIVDFLKYSISEISNYRRNAGIHGFHSYNSNRALSQYKVAEILGVKWLMPKIEYAKIKVDEGPIRFGILSMAVEGVDPTYVDNKRLKVMPSVQRELNILHILDVICYEKDHRPSNYYVKQNKEGELTGISVFDNDSAASFSILPSVRFSTDYGSVPLLDSNNCFAIGYIDRCFFEKLNSVNFEDLTSNLSPFLSKVQILSLFIRIKRIIKGVENAIRQDKIQVLNENQWTKETLDDELSGRYGQTYLETLINWSKYMTKPKFNP